LTDTQKAEIKVIFEKVRVLSVLPQLSINHHILQYDTNKSNTIDKNELRAVLEESLHRNLPDKLYTKYVETVRKAYPAFHFLSLT